jgi:hypothetical protein
MRFLLKKVFNKLRQINLRLKIGEYIMATLAEIRAKLKAAETRSSGERTGGDRSIYPFWNLKEGGESVLRFLPDKNPNNTFFWVERAMIKLPFAGIDGETDNKETIVQVPCMEMYGETCPILTEVRGWFKDKSLEDMGRKYWKKKSYIFQGFVVDDGLGEKSEEKPENPIRRFIIGPQIFKLIHGAIMDPELEDLPTDFVNGIDFRMKKGSKGGYADYSTSTWSRRTRPLSDEEQAAIAEHDLFNLSEYLPKKPTDVELKVIKEMFEASVEGKPFDMERWGQYFKPAGMSQNTGDPNKAQSTPTQSAPAPKAVVQADPVDEDEPVAPAKGVNVANAASGDSRAQDILAMIRNRQK